MSFVKSVQAAPPELDMLRQQYDKILSERVTVPHETALAALNKKFTSALDSAANEAKQAGKLDDVLAIQADLKRIVEKQPLLAEDAESTPESLKKLRTIYREQSARLEETRAANVDALVAPFSAKLQELEVSLTRADRIEDATQVRKHRESLALSMPPVPPAMSEAAVTMPAAAPAPEPKGADRRAAEWVLGFAVPGGDTNVIVESAAGKKQCFTLADLPAGELALTHFVITAFRKPLQKPISNQDTMILVGLQHLREFQFNKIGITDEGFGFVSSCPELGAINIHNLDVTDEVFRHFAGLKKLKRITYNNSGKTMTGTGFHLLAEAELETINMEGSGMNDAGIPHLLAFTELTSLDLTATRVTDEGLRALASLKSLVSLNVSNTTVTPAGLFPLEGLKLTALSFGRRETWDSLAPTLPPLASAFPDVEETVLPRSGTYTAVSIDPLVDAFSKLRILKIEESKFGTGALDAVSKFSKLEQLNLRLCKIGDADLAGLATLRALKHLNLNDTQVTDAVLETLSEFKSLKTLMLSGTDTTPAGLSVFQKDHPDVEIQDRYYIPPR